MSPREVLVESGTDELTRLIELLQETQQRIITLTDGLVDAVMPASGNLLLLPNTQTHFRDQAIAYQAFAAERSAILDALPAHVALLNATGEIRSGNAVWLSFAERLSAMPGLAVGSVYADFWSIPEAFRNVDAAGVRVGIAAVLSRKRGLFDVEFCLHLLPSKPWFRLVVASLADDAERGAVVMHIDITGQKANEEKVRQMQRLDALGQLTGGVAHDFNNLLMVIMGNSEALLDSLAEDEQRRDWAELIVLASEKGAALTNRLLAFARRQALAPETIDLSALLAGVVQLLQRTIGEHISITVSAFDGPCHVHADRSQLENAVINLCINARDAMLQGGTITINLASRDILPEDKPPAADLASGDYVVLTVSDTGSGMDAATLMRSCEPFFTTKPMGKGTGLGLSVVYGFIKQSNGAISIDSTVGEGTDVHLWLPRVPEAATKVAPSSLPNQGVKGERILLAEDDPLVARSVCQQLVGFGYRVETVSSGAEALAYLAQDAAFDLVFTDIVMPGGVGGLELAREAGRLYPHLKFLLTSGYADALDDALRVRLAGNLIAKPYKRSALGEKLDALLRQAPAVG
ncbi:ATP-binding protein [Oryzifoliimicrobium ureilyticus]|uniref:ATP-binding protein n=1 Tax=Oryzifoliimicrobium ureilyticus TaxID=3113724 RepID=UPI0030764D6F